MYLDMADSLYEYSKKISSMTFNITLKALDVYTRVRCESRIFVGRSLLPIRQRLPLRILRDYNGRSCDRDGLMFHVMRS